ncbi:MULTISPECIES: FAD:protein FMN transferase [Proteiniphilum]|jgi:thiamine biosynthesis lipoprotein|uniref:FAD:protein FMN transferase n=2 Tax=Dysgonomonadaceae TaxID=2005520 RepID=UPI00389A4957
MKSSYENVKLTTYPEKSCRSHNSRIKTDSGYFHYYEYPMMLHGSLQNIMGTRFDILIIDKSKPESEYLWSETVSELHRLDKMMNRFDPLSEISIINRDASDNPIRVTSEMWSVLQSCRQYYLQTLGLFDITLKDFSKVGFAWQDKSIYFSQPGLSLDLGGYAKGYALKKIKQYLVNAGVQHCFVDFGNSSVLGMGHHPYGDAWKISIVNPFNPGENLNEISLRDEALSVSGNTPTYTGHIVRPASGESIKERKIISITSKDPLEAEILSTAFMMAGREEKKNLSENFKIKNIIEYSL